MKDLPFLFPRQPLIFEKPPAVVAIADCSKKGEKPHFF